MDNEKLKELPVARKQTEKNLESLRVPMTILFSDIRGSTAYAEKHGDVEYMNMINRHNAILFPIIQGQGGRVVKTIGDAILAQFDDRPAAVKAAVGMQRALAKDREGRDEIDQIRIRIGLHYGTGLTTENDVFGDVVNAASRVQNQADAEQILITDALLDAAHTAGFECAKMGRFELRGKDEPVNLYAVAWSDSATQQLIQEVEARYEKKLQALDKEHQQLEQEFQNARNQWRIERRTLNSEIEQLEDLLENARHAAQQHGSEDLHSELRFQLDEAIRGRQRLEEDLAVAQEKFDGERRRLEGHIASMQASVVDAMERSNNPARVSMLVREQVEARLASAREEWQSQWDSERRRFQVEIERLRKLSEAGGASEKREAARRALLEKLGKTQASPVKPAGKTAEQWERELQEARTQWEAERKQLNQKIGKLQTGAERSEDVIRAEIFQEMRAQYEPRLVEANRERQVLQEKVQALTKELSAERQRLNARITQLERTIPEAQDAARKQALAELQSQFELQLEEANRFRLRIERKQQDLSEEWEEERRNAKKQIAQLDEDLKEARLALEKALNSSDRRF
jgi:class 3 adenylate cyclase